MSDTDIKILRLIADEDPIEALSRIMFEAPEYVQKRYEALVEQGFVATDPLSVTPLGLRRLGRDPEPAAP